MRRRGSDCVTMLPCPEKFIALKQGDLKAGEGVLIDQFTSSITGRLIHTKGRVRPEEKLTGGTLFVDHSSGYIFVQLQVSQRAGESSWDVETTSAISEGLAEQDIEPSQVENAVVLQREHPMSQRESAEHSVQNDDVSLEREDPILQREREENLGQNADVSLEREDVSRESSSAVETSRVVKTSSVAPRESADEHVQ